MRLHPGGHHLRAAQSVLGHLHTHRSSVLRIHSFRRYFHHPSQLYRCVHCPHLVRCPCQPCGRHPLDGVPALHQPSESHDDHPHRPDEYLLSLALGHHGPLSLCHRCGPAHEGCFQLILLCSLLELLQSYCDVYCRSPPPYHLHQGLVQEVYPQSHYHQLYLVVADPADPVPAGVVQLLTNPLPLHRVEVAVAGRSVVAVPAATAVVVVPAVVVVVVAAAAALPLRLLLAGCPPLVQAVSL
mmetsp:Transcript_7692/g.13671  ORF Transcript_7692/g.13671 Transcript_7692/m.13671 type:complete len:241 (+) Transcript_7692:313-1035(+)